MRPSPNTRRLFFTHKSLAEMAQLGLDREDAREVLLGLQIGDFHRRIRSGPEWLFVFKPELCGTLLYLKVALRGECVVISFHEDNDDEDTDG